MQIVQTGIPGLVLVKPGVFKDQRGYFFESYNKKKFEDIELHADFIQDNQSRSSYGVVRGLHYQLEPHAQTKLVRVLQGRILDVTVDIRKNSPAFGKSFSIEMTTQNQIQIWVPAGFAHGFSVLSETAVVFYKCDAFYEPASERGIYARDTFLDIDWRIPPERMKISPKDSGLPGFEQAEMNFTFPTGKR